MSGHAGSEPRLIAHVDMDAFFVSVELLRRPELRGEPVVVGGAGERGVVMAASYEARRFGVRSAMPMVKARRLCPRAVIVPRDMQAYVEASGRVMEVLRRFSDTVEVAGLDEAYLDLSGSPAPKARARQIKGEVREETGLVCSVGLAANKLCAKIASDLEKPDGLCVLGAEDFLPRVGDRPARLIPGVGPRTAERLARAGIRTVAQLAGAGDEALAAALGPRFGPEIRARARGHDERPLVTHRQRKSESRERTFPEDVTDRAVQLTSVQRLADSVCESLARHRSAGRTVTLKIRLRPFRTHTRSRTLPSPTRERQLVAAVARELLEEFDPAEPVRLLGVGVAGLVTDGAPAPASGESEGEGEAAAGPTQLALASPEGAAPTSS